MFLLIDVGNTRVKWLLINDCYDESQLQYGSLKNLSDFIKDIDAPNTIVLLAAVNDSEALQGLLSSSDFKEVHKAFSKAEQLGVCNSYAEPQRMGVDRWLAMIAGFSITKGDNSKNGVIIIDAGSALTVDVVDYCGQHLGGYIVPGIEMAKRALFCNTERVREYKEPIERSLLFSRENRLGMNTLQCVEHGVIAQLVSLINSVIEIHDNHQIIFTGGDGEYLANFFHGVRIEKNLVLKGLWEGRA